MPKWGHINERRNQLHEVIRLSGMNLIINDTDHPLIIKVASIPSARIQVYFIDNDDYFSHRLMDKDEEGKEYADNAERAIFYARGVLETVKKLRWTPDVVHCQGWMSSIIPVYLKMAYKDEPSFRDCKVIYTPTGEDLKAPLPDNFRDALIYKKMDIAQAMEGIEGSDMQVLNQLALKYADGMSLLEEDSCYRSLIEKSGKPCLEHDEKKEITDEYTEFYDLVWNLGKEDEEED